jgi:hypothetical protein
MSSIDLGGGAPPPPPAAPPTPPATLDVGRTLGRTPEQLAIDRADFVRMGGSGQAFDRAIGVGVPAAPAIAAPPPAFDPVQRAADMRLATAKAFVGAYQNAHRFDPPEVDQSLNLAAALRAGGYSDAEIATLTAGPAADTRSADLQLADRGGLAPASSPADYPLIAYPQSFAASLPLGELAVFDAGAREALHAMGVPPGQGTSLVLTAVEAAQTYQKMSPAEQHAWTARQDEALTAAFGSRETALEAVELAGAMLAKAPTAFLEDLRQSGAVRSAMFITALAHLADGQNLRAEIAAGRSFAAIWRDNRL